MGPQKGSDGDDASMESHIFSNVIGLDRCPSTATRVGRRVKPSENTWDKYI